MKIRLYVTETVRYEQVVEVDENFNLDDQTALRKLWISEQDPELSFVAVDHVSIVSCAQCGWHCRTQTNNANEGV